MTPESTIVLYFILLKQAFISALALLSSSVLSLSSAWTGTAILGRERAICQIFMRSGSVFTGISAELARI
jgi:hypothetical protein